MINVTKEKNKAGSWINPAYNKKASSYYTVKDGGTLSEIAVNHNTTLNNLIQPNDIKGANKIYVGQKIRLKYI